MRRNYILIIEVISNKLSCRNSNSNSNVNAHGFTYKLEINYELYLFSTCNSKITYSVSLFVCAEIYIYIMSRINNTDFVVKACR